jgi:hypothetical protein
LGNAAGEALRIVGKVIKKGQPRALFWGNMYGCCIRLCILLILNFKKPPRLTISNQLLRIVYRVVCFKTFTKRATNRTSGVAPNVLKPTQP